MILVLILRINKKKLNQRLIKDICKIKIEISIEISHIFFSLFIFCSYLNPLKKKLKKKLNIRINKIYLIQGLFNFIIKIAYIYAKFNSLSSNFHALLYSSFFLFLVFV